MAKRPLEFDIKPNTKQAKVLSPSKVTEATPNATVSGVVTSLSPIHPSRYFDGEVTDGECVMRLVGFDKVKRQELQALADYNIPVTFKHCLIQENKFKKCLEIILKSHTKIEPSEINFDVSDPKTVGSSIIQLNQLCEIPEESRVTIRVVIMKVNEPQQVGSGKIKQDIIVADNTNKATVTLWQPYLNILKAQCSYQLNRLQIKTYQGKRHLSFSSAPSIDEIENIEDPIEVFTSSDEESDEILSSVTISGIRVLETVYTCINCNKTIPVTDSPIATCNHCDTAQKWGKSKQSAKLIFDIGSKRLTLRANDNELKIICSAQSEVTSQDLLYAPPFDVSYNKYNAITKVTRQ